MKSELLERSPLLALPLIAFVLFLAVFITVLVVTLTKKSRAYEPIARLPLNDDGEES